MNAKALITALTIVEVCKEYGRHDRCLECPFNIEGCIVANGNDIPEYWHINDVIISHTRRLKNEEDNT